MALDIRSVKAMDLRWYFRPTVARLFAFIESRAEFWRSGLASAAAVIRFRRDYRISG